MNTIKAKNPDPESVAWKRFQEGESQSYSTSITGRITAGYGQLDDTGEFEYPLIVDQKTYRPIEPF